MKQQVSPMTAILVVLAVAVIAAFSWVQFSSGTGGSRADEKPPGMPPNVAAEFQKRMGGTTIPATSNPKQSTATH